ncbi:MAG: ammonium transporter, partial [Verrucomicrobiota bacterium]
VIHGIGGAFALAGIKILGPRHDRFNTDGIPKIVTGHSLPQAAVGTLLVWLGWFGLGLGQTLVAGYEIQAVGRIAVNFAIAAAGGSVFASLSVWRQRGRSDLNFALNGILAGLVSISASADQVHPLAALLIGGVAGLFAAWGISYLESRQLDDVVGAVPVHLYAGVWGALAVSLIGPFSVEFFLIQLLGVTTICGLAFLIGILLFKAVEIGLGLRASDEDQAAGLDFSEHATTAYPEFDLQES